MEPMRFLGIPITPIGYGMNNLITKAQFELLAIDVSVTDYGTTKKKGKRDLKDKFEDFGDADAADVQNAGERWLEKYGKGEKPHIDMSAFMAPAEKTTYTLGELKELSEQK